MYIHTTILIESHVISLQGGNGVQEMEEECDGPDLGDHTCQNLLGSP